MKYTVEEFLSKLPLPANEKWKDGVWFGEVSAKVEHHFENFTDDFATWVTFF